MQLHVQAGYFNAEEQSYAGKIHIYKAPYERKSLIYYDMPERDTYACMYSSEGRGIYIFSAKRN